MHPLLLVLALAAPQATPEETLGRRWQAATSVTISIPGRVVVFEKKEAKELLAAVKVNYVWQDAAGATEPTVFIQFRKNGERFGILGVVGSGRDRVLELQSDQRIVGVSPQFAEGLNKLVSARLKKKVDVLKIEP